MINNNLYQATKSANEISDDVSYQEDCQTEYYGAVMYYKNAVEKYEKYHTDEDIEYMIKCRNELAKSINTCNYYFDRAARRIKSTLDYITDYVKELGDKADMGKVSQLLAKIYGDMPNTIGGSLFYMTIRQSIKKCRDAISSEDICFYLLDSIEELARKISYNIKEKKNRCK